MEGRRGLFSDTEQHANKPTTPPKVDGEETGLQDLKLSARRGERRTGRSERREEEKNDRFASKGRSRTIPAEERRLSGCAES
jgi:hypothetical protein